MRERQIDDAAAIELVEENLYRRKSDGMYCAAPTLQDAIYGFHSRDTMPAWCRGKYEMFQDLGNGEQIVGLDHEREMILPGVVIRYGVEGGWLRGHIKEIKRGKWRKP